MFILPPTHPPRTHLSMGMGTGELSLLLMLSISCCNADDVLCTQYFRPCYDPLQKYNVPLVLNAYLHTNTAASTLHFFILKDYASRSEWNGAFLLVNDHAFIGLLLQVYHFR